MFLAMVNAKGGVGKSTLAVHLAVWLHERGQRVMLVDCDLQRSSSQWMAEAAPEVRVEVLLSEDELIERSTWSFSRKPISSSPMALQDSRNSPALYSSFAIPPLSHADLRYSTCEQSLKLFVSSNKRSPYARGFQRPCSS